MPIHILRHQKKSYKQRQNISDYYQARLEMDPRLPAVPPRAHEASQPAPSSHSGNPAHPPPQPGLLEGPAGSQETRHCRGCDRTLPVSHFRGVRKKLVQRCQKCRSRKRAREQQSVSAIVAMSAIAGGRYNTGNQNVETPLPHAPQAAVETPLPVSNGPVGPRHQLHESPAQHASPESAESRRRLTVPSTYAIFGCLHSLPIL